MSIRLTSKIFIIRSKIIHKEKYDYSLVEYINRGKKVKIICPIHGVFEQLAGDHLGGHGCTKCRKSNGLLKNTEQFIKEAIEKYGDKYGYEKVIYINAKTKVIIICPIHGDFEQTPNNHLFGKGCQICAGNIKKDICQFVKEAVKKHGDLYSYLKAIYVNRRTKVIITCSVHGDFEQAPSDHLSGQGCLKCTKSISKIETEWLDSLHIDKKYHQKTIKIGNVIIRADAYVPETNTVYEFHGNYWHGNPKLFKADDINKRSKKTFGELYQKTLDREELIRNAGYNLVVMWESDFKINNRII